MKNLVKKNRLASTICLFLVIYLFIMLLKPVLLFNNDGTIRNFGLGKTRSTIIPVWLFGIVTAILSYVSVLYYIHIR